MVVVGKNLLPLQLNHYHMNHFIKMQLQSPGAIPKQALFDIACTPIRDYNTHTSGKMGKKARVILADKTINGGW
jgi:hypothetical protein